MTKTTGKAPAEPRPGVGGPSQGEIRLAYEAHTLARMLYGRLAMTHPWIGTMPGARGFDPQARPGIWNAGPVSHPVSVPHMFGLEMYPH